MNKTCNIRTKSGELIIISKNSDLILDENKIIIGGIESFDDITNNLVPSSKTPSSKEVISTNPTLENINLDKIGILIVDDNKSTIMQINSFLENTNAQTFHVFSSKEAIHFLLKDATNENITTIVIIKYDMPIMNGKVLSDTLQTLPLTKDKSLILLTSSKNQSSPSSELESIEQIFEPLNKTNLLQSISNVLGIEFEALSSIENNTVIDDNLISNSPKILLVEDSEVNMIIMSTALTNKGMSCDIAYNGLEGVNACFNKEYDIILMDCQMPTMDGYEATKRIRNSTSKNQKTAIIAITANTVTDNKNRCILSGMNDHLCKPVNYNVLYEKIQKYTLDKNTPEYIKNFMKDTGFGKEETKNIFILFVNSATEIIEKLDQKIASLNFPLISKLAHKLKGSSANLRITSIYELTIKLEESANNQEKEKCIILIKKISKIIHNLSY